jgi:hypothetical protein
MARTAERSTVTIRCLPCAISLTCGDVLSFEINRLGEITKLKGMLQYQHYSKLFIAFPAMRLNSVAITKY